MRILRAANHKHMPWKNGGGETVEIAVFPEGASLDAFDWRVSMARVDGDGPFSSFPDIDRTLTILDGSGIVLDIEGRAPLRLTLETPPLAFPADLPTSAALIGGSVVDFNVMSRRGKVVHDVARHVGPAASPSGTIRLILCDTGRIEIVSRGERTALESRDAAILDLEEAADIAPVGESTFYLVEFRPA